MTLTDEDRALTYEEAERLALLAIHDVDGRGMVGRGRNHLHQRVARALLSAARQASTQGPGEGWQPIETAPTDGTWVDLWVAGKEDEIPNDANYRRIVGRWWKSRGDEPSGWHIGLGPPPEGYAVSHWRPLPAPPASQTQEG